MPTALASPSSQTQQKLAIRRIRRCLGTPEFPAVVNGLRLPVAPPPPPTHQLRRKELRKSPLRISKLLDAIGRYCRCACQTRCARGSSPFTGLLD